MTDHLEIAKKILEISCTPADHPEQGFNAPLFAAQAQAAALIAIAEKTETQPELLIDASLLWAARSALKWLENLREAGHTFVLIACQPEDVGMKYLEEAVNKYEAR